MEKIEYIEKPKYTVEKLNMMFSEIFTKYADQEDDNLKNVENGTDFTSFSWNIYHKDFTLNDKTKNEIQEDINKLISIERDYRLNLKNHHQMPEIITGKLKQIEKIFNTIKNIYPEVKISENLRNI